MDLTIIKTIYEAIAERISVREYAQIIKPELCDYIDAFIEKINKEEDIFQLKTRFLLMRKDFNRIWSFGFVSGNKYWLCWCINKDNPLGEVSIWIKNGKNNFIFTNLGPDIIWLGRTYTTSCFTKALNLDEKTEKLVWVSPIGYRNPNKKGLINYFSKRKRNDWNKKFFFEKPSMPMTEKSVAFLKKK